MNQDSAPLHRRLIRTAMVTPAVLSLALFLTACSQAEWDRFIEGLILMLLATLALIIVMACTSLLYFGFCVASIVYNFAKPNRFSMFTSWILGGINIIMSMVGAAGTIASGFDTKFPTPLEGVIGGVISALLGVAFGAFMIWSGVHARNKLNGAGPIDQQDLLP